MRVFVVAVIFAALFFLLIIGVRDAVAHDQPHWISRDHPGCCTAGTPDGDCQPVPVSAVRITPQGFIYGPTGELIPFDEAKPSQDGEYHRCAAPPGYATRCFFAPIPGS